MDTNRHAGFRGEAAWECGGLTPLSRPRFTNGEGLVSFGGLADNIQMQQTKAVKY
jgi:hypothetical protein